MNDKDDGARPSTGDEPNLSRRLRDLERRLEDKRPEDDAEAYKPPPQGVAMALRLASDFVAGVVLGAVLGWGFDQLFGTSPWGLMVFLLLGFGAGILSILRTAGLAKPGPSGPDDIGDGI